MNMAEKQIAIIESALGENAYRMVSLHETTSEAWTRLVIQKGTTEAQLKALLKGNDWVIENGDWQNEFFIQNKRVLNGNYELATLLKIEDFVYDLMRYADTTPTLEEVDNAIIQRGEWQDGDDWEREEAAKAEAIREISKTILAVIRNEKEKRN